jgi:probable phosphoglycerate mutase
VSSGELVVVRHADTDWTASGQHTGHTDLPLNAAGRAAAARLGPLLAGWSFAEVWCSPLARAVQTCELAGFAARASQRALLEEWNYGEYEGLTTDAIKAQRPAWDLWRDGCPGGEDAAAVGARADRALAELPPAGDVLIFSHGHFLRVLTARWLRLAATEGALFVIAPGTIGVLGFEHSNHVIARLGAS